MARQSNLNWKRFRRCTLRGGAISRLAERLTAVAGQKNTRLGEGSQGGAVERFPIGFLLYGNTTDRQGRWYATGIGNRGQFSPKMRWKLLLAVIFIPTILTVLSALLGGRDVVATSFGAAGAAFSGLCGGVLLGRRIGRTEAGKVGLSVDFIFVLGVACLTMNCIGCLAGGYKLNLH